MTASRVTSVYTSIIITLVPAILTVALRFYPKRIRKIKPWWDDWIALFALVCPFAVQCDNAPVYANSPFRRCQRSSTMPLPSSVRFPRVATSGRR